MKSKPPKAVETNFTGFEVANFRIDVNDKSFRILLDGMYAKKIPSIQRETMTNAYDSHLEAGCPDRPFVVHLPSLLDPTFSVRDFGVSMTHEHVMELYTTVFWSSKEQTNDLVGQLGLGSKSPFAYTDSFTVTAWRDGEKRIYLASIGNGGVPTMTHLHTTPSDEETGLEISFPVQAKDYAEFAQEAGEVAMGFDVQPIFQGAEVTVPEPVFSDLGWRIYKGRPNSVRQGCVIYPITQMNLSTPLNAGYGNSYGLMVDMPIGSCEVAANREALQFDDRTKQNVLDGFSNVVKGIVEYVESRIAECPNRISAERQYHAWRTVFQYNKLPKIKFRGKELSGMITLDPAKEDIPEILLSKNFESAKTQKVYNFGVGDLVNMKFVIDRTTQKVLRRRIRIREYRNDHKNEVGYQGQYLLVVRDPTSKQLANLVRRLGLTPDQIIPIASLPDVPPPTYAKDPDAPPISRQGMYVLNSYGPRKYEGEIAEEYYHLPIDRGVPSQNVFPKWQSYGVELQRLPAHIMPLIEAFKLDDRPLYLLTSNAQKRLKVTEETEFFAALDAAILENEKEILARARRIGQRRAFDSGLYSKHSGIVAKLVCEAEGIVLTENPALQNINLNMQPIRYLLQKKIEAAMQAGEDSIMKVAEKYPLIFGQPDEAGIKEYIQYIKTKEQENG